LGQKISEGLVKPDIDRSDTSRLRFKDYLLLVIFCSVLFGYVAVSGRPLTLHEARLPETSREMMASHDWLVPMDGDRPWLERPPFPHWCMIAVAKAIGQKCDTEWSVGIPPALAGLLIVLMTARMAAGWFGRGVGLMSGLMLATMWEFYTYSTLAEDDVFLALLVVAAIALFVGQEFAVDPLVGDKRIRIFCWRSWRVVGFFILLGLTNLAKGPIVGAAVVVGTISAYFLMPSVLWTSRDLSLIFHFPPEQRRRVRRYFWLWGILAAVVIALSWHVYMARLFPGPGGYLANLRYDFSETHEFDEPWWYYPANLIWRAMPWTPLAIFALALTARQVWQERDAVMRFLWCWAIVPFVVLSLPHRKHHHYLVPSLAPWAILAACGAKPAMQWALEQPIWSRRPSFGLLMVVLPVCVVIGVLGCEEFLSPANDWRSQIQSGAILMALTAGGVGLFYFGLFKARGAWMLAAIVIGFGGAYSWSQTHLRDETVPDTRFLIHAVEPSVPMDKLLAINAAIGPLDFFRVQFYLRPDALVLHNLSYLRSDKIHSGDVYVIGQFGDLSLLQQLGEVKVLAISPRLVRPGNPELTLFYLIFSADLKRYPAPRVSVMQAMMREDGPWCGPEMSK
jgi:4-amino-4-deoxy-L-arabinose transferase-like glycosyltransferase